MVGYLKSIVSNQKCIDYIEKWSQKHMPGAVGSMSDCISRDRKFESSARLHNFRGDWSWNNFYSPSPPSADSGGALLGKVCAQVLVNCLAD